MQTETKQLRVRERNHSASANHPPVPRFVAPTYLSPLPSHLSTINHQLPYPAHCPSTTSHQIPVNPTIKKIQSHPPKQPTTAKPRTTPQAQRKMHRFAPIQTNSNHINRGGTPLRSDYQPSTYQLSTNPHPPRHHPICDARTELI
jgi:hypothetical protein